jgi:glutamate-1-semialdehyde aminotransferase
VSNGALLIFDEVITGFPWRVAARREFTELNLI